MTEYVLYVSLEGQDAEYPYQSADPTPEGRAFLIQTLKNLVKRGVRVVSHTIFEVR